MALAGLIIAVVVSAGTRQTVHSYRGSLRTLSKPTPAVLPGILIGTVVSWTAAAVVSRRSARFAGYGFGALALLLSLIGAGTYDRKIATFNQMLARAKEPWTQAHAAAVAWLLPVFAVVYLVVYWNAESAGRTGTRAPSPRGRGRR